MCCYDVIWLVYYEIYEMLEDVICCEKCLKCWFWVWKIWMIEMGNFDWEDFYEDLN